MREIFWGHGGDSRCLVHFLSTLTKPDFLNQSGYFKPPTGTIFQNLPFLCRLKPVGIPERYLRTLGIYVVQRTPIGDFADVNSPISWDTWYSLAFHATETMFSICKGLRGYGVRCDYAIRPKPVDD